MNINSFEHDFGPWALESGGKSLLDCDIEALTKAVDELEAMSDETGKIASDVEKEKFPEWFEEYQADRLKAIALFNGGDPRW
jgi:hypothetical protein